MIRFNRKDRIKPRSIIPEPNSDGIVWLKLEFDEYTLNRRASLGLLPEIKDPDCENEMRFSRLKTSRQFVFLNDTDDQITMDGGYRLARGTNYFQLPGKYYWEIEFTEAKQKESHIRIGIATIDADMEAPVGFDKEGYAVRDLGSTYHDAEKTAAEPFGVGDVVGLGFESHDDDEKLASLHYWINGEYKGIAFNDIDATKKWYPAVSIYYNAVVTGYFSSKSFKFPPPSSWNQAANSKPQPEGKFSVPELGAIMATSIRSDHPNFKELITAIDKALVPPQFMVI